MVAQVQSGSVAERAGVTVGDFVLKVCGRDIRTADGEQVLRMMREEAGKAVEVAVARPYPVPLTDKEKMRALLVLQTKVSLSSSGVCVSLSHPVSSHSWTVAPYSSLQVGHCCHSVYVMSLAAA